MCGPHFCSMKITQDVREYAANQKIDEKDALSAGMQAKAIEFVKNGAEILQEAVSDVEGLRPSRHPLTRYKQKAPQMRGFLFLLA